MRTVCILSCCGGPLQQVPLCTIFVVAVDPLPQVKLDANENPYGPPPEVPAALGSMPFPNIYPGRCMRMRRLSGQGMRRHCPGLVLRRPVSCCRVQFVLLRMVWLLPTFALRFNWQTFASTITQTRSRGGCGRRWQSGTACLLSTCWCA